MRLIILKVLIVLVVITSCSNQTEQVIFNVEADPIGGLASPVIITPDLNQILLTDFIINIDEIDSVTFCAGKFLYDKINGVLEIKSDFNDLPQLSLVSIWKDQNKYDIIGIKRPVLTQTVNFSCPFDLDYSEVMIAGDFNSWNPGNDFLLQKKDDTWSINLELDAGVYQYQIVADGNWMNNYRYGDTVSNGLGGFNTILKVNNPCQISRLFIQTEIFSDNNIEISYNQIPERLFILWENQLIPANLSELESFKYRFPIPTEAKEIQRSHIRVFACTKDCIANDLLIPLEYGKPIKSSNILTRHDLHSNIMYSLMIDRFYNADSKNDIPVRDSRVADRANYQGGDIKGIIKKINDGYFADLNINMLWISPVTQNPWEAFREFPAPQRYYSGYHGYWPISSTEVDKRFGDQKTFRKMVETAHQNEINIILDFVANHVHEQHPLYKENPDWATDLILEDGQKNIRIWDEQRLTTWFDTFLPSWDFGKNEVIDTITEIALYWLQEYNLDGFRHDATKHIPEEFWRTLTYKIKTKIPERKVYQVGETFGSRKLIGSYVGSGLLDGQFDFNLYFDARNAFSCSQVNLANLAISLNASLNFYGHNHLMSNISGNHDLVRFITNSDGGIKPGEDDKEAGWNRHIEVQNVISYNKLKNMMAFIMTIPGIPCIYYGDEFGMPGANDPDNRRMMKFSDYNTHEQECLNVVTKLTELRRSRPELIYGTTRIINSGQNFIIYKRKYFESETIVIITNSDEQSKIHIPVHELNNIEDYNSFNNWSYKNENNNYIFEADAHAFEILSLK